MAAIDKIYASSDEAKEFIKWIENEADSKFKEEFKEAGEVSLKKFMYSTTIEDIEKNWSNDRKFPLTNFPELVDIWLLKQPGLPKFAFDEICFEYRLDTNEKIERFLNRSIEEKYVQPSGKHAKILSRTGVFKHSDYFEKGYIEVDNSYHKRMWLEKHYPNENSFERLQHLDEFYKKYPERINEEYWWYHEETDDWENSLYPKKKNIYTSSSSMQYIGKTSLKSMIRKILKRYDFPVGTIIKLSELRYIGGIYVKILK